MEGDPGGVEVTTRATSFLRKTYAIVDDPTTDAVVSWSHTGTSFVVTDPNKFAHEILPMHFKHSRFHSFHRQLNAYVQGFKKVSGSVFQCEFENANFIRGQIHLLANIKRKKSCRRPRQLVHVQNVMGNPSPAVFNEVMDVSIDDLFDGIEITSSNLQGHSDFWDAIDDMTFFPTP